MFNGIWGRIFVSLKDFCFQVYLFVDYISFSFLCEISIRGKSVTINFLGAFFWEPITKIYLDVWCGTAWVVLVPSSQMEVCPHSYFQCQWCDCEYFGGPWVSFVTTDEFATRVIHKNYFKDWCLMNLQSTFLFLTNLNLVNYGHNIIKNM